MSVIETVMVFACIPLAVVLVITALVYGRSALHQPNRYRPGKPWTYPPAWYVPHPDAVADSVPDHAAIEGSHTRTVAAGGASGEW